MCSFKNASKGTIFSTASVVFTIMFPIALDEMGIAAEYPESFPVSAAKQDNMKAVFIKGTSFTCWPVTLGGTLLGEKNRHQNVREGDPSDVELGQSVSVVTFNSCGKSVFQFSHVMPKALMNYFSLGGLFH